MQFWKRNLLLASLASLASFSLIAADAVKPETTAAPADEIDIKKVSEAFGHFIGKNLKNSGLNFDLDTFVMGIRSGMEGKPAPLSDKEYERQMMLLQEKSFKQLADTNLKTAEDFLKKNATEKGVVELEPGKIQILVVKPGTGAEVKDGNAPQIQYTGKYADGTVFGSSQDTGGPITIPLDQTIPGFSKGLKGMKEGEVRKIFVHPDQGYGKSGHLPPNSLLIFDVELIKADNPEQAQLDGKDAYSYADKSMDDGEDDEDDADDDEEEEVIISKPAATPVKK